MPADLYMKVQDAKGESKDADHKDWILIESANFGMSMAIPNSPAQSGQRAAGTADFGEISVSKSIDKSSPSLFLACANGKPYTEDIEIDFVQPMGEERLVYLTLKLSKCIISSYSLSSGAQGTAYENLTLNYSKYIMEYNPQENDKAVGVMPAGWDLEINKKV